MQRKRDEVNKMTKRQPKRTVKLRDLSEDQFMEILKKVCQPVNRPQIHKRPQKAEEIEKNNELV